MGNGEICCPFLLAVANHLVDGVCGRIAFRHWNGDDHAAVGFDYVVAYNILFLVVAAFNQYVGYNGFYQIEGGVFVEKGYRIDER